MFGYYLEGKEISHSLAFSMAQFFYYYYFTINLVSAWGIISIFALFSTFNRIGEILA